MGLSRVDVYAWAGFLLVTGGAAQWSLAAGCLAAGVVLLLFGVAEGYLISTKGRRL